MKAVADACRKYGIGFAVYYSAWDRHEASYVNPVKYTQYMKAQLTELLTNYGPVCEVWFDGSWDRKAQDWQMAQIYDHIKRLQPDCQVTMNWTIGHPDRPDCTVRPAQQRNGYPIRYFPCDFRIGDPDLPVANDPKHFGHDGKSYYMPYEATVTVSKRDHWFGFAGDEGAKSVAALEEIFWRATAQDNLLVFNIPPDKNGDLIPSQVKAVQELAQRLNLGANKPFPQPAAR